MKSNPIADAARPHRNASNAWQAHSDGFCLLVIAIHKQTNRSFTMSAAIGKLFNPSTYTGAMASTVKRAQAYYHPMLRNNR
jgi:hypothetical protein